MDLTLAFSKSRSGSFGQVVRECSKFNEFTFTDGRYTLTISYMEALSLWDSFQIIFANAVNWASFEFKIKDRPVAGRADIKRIYYDLQELMYCLKQYQTVADPEAYCAQDFWGCNRLKSVQVMPDFYHTAAGWFSFGTLVDGNWKIDKQRILGTLLKEAQLKHLDSCPNFNQKRIEHVVQALPDQIDIATRNWKLKTSLQFADGTFKQVCTGIEWTGHYAEYKPENFLIRHT